MCCVSVCICCLFKNVLLSRENAVQQKFSKVYGCIYTKHTQAEFHTYKPCFITQNDMRDLTIMFLFGQKKAGEVSNS